MAADLLITKSGTHVGVLTALKVALTKLQNHEAIPIDVEIRGREARTYLLTAIGEDALECQTHSAIILIPFHAIDTIRVIK